MNLKSDPHSFYEQGQPKIEGLVWAFELDFAAQVLTGSVRYVFDAPGETYLDTRDLTINSVSTQGGNDIPYELGDIEELRGARLSFDVPDDHVVIIEYTTDPGAHGIQWMSPEIAGGKPFVYTQGEAINARTYIPCQDTPSVKFTMEARVTVPEGIRGLVAAAEYKGRTPDNDNVIETWAMEFPVPSYLIAFAVGDVVEAPISLRSSIWAQPHMLERAVDEFNDLPRLIEAGERLFGPYPFGRYSILVMPDAFPYGGMENPCLSFLTPALVAGDGSGISTVAHELAHSWTGNLVTNADWSSFWLNEGWTVWAEDRIIEAVYGRDTAMLGRKLLEREFEEDLAYFKRRDQMQYTALAPDVSDIDPDDVFSRVPYFKGAQFLTLIEETVGRERFDAFALSYISAYGYESIDTRTFLDYLRAELGDEVFKAVRAREWVYHSGYPDNAPAIVSSLVDEVEEAANKLFIPHKGMSWTKPQWQLYLELLPEQGLFDQLKLIDYSWSLSKDPNLEVRWSFLVRAVKAGLYDVYAKEVEELLRTQGRMKYLKPLYGALCEAPEGHLEAQRIFTDAMKTYHPVAVAAVERVLCDS